MRLNDFSVDVKEIRVKGVVGRGYDVASLTRPFASESDELFKAPARTGTVSTVPDGETLDLTISLWEPKDRDK